MSGPYGLGGDWMTAWTPARTVAGRRAGAKGSAHSNGIIDVYEVALKPAVGGKVSGQRLHPETLGGMMPGGEEGHPAFARQMDVVFGNLAGDEGVDAERHRLLEVALGTARAPGDAFDRTPRRTADDERGTTESRRQRIASTWPASTRCSPRWSGCTRSRAASAR